MRLIKIMWFLTLSILVILTSVIIFHQGRKEKLIVAFLDVGQGDSIFIQAPNGNQVLVDSGSTKQILHQLGEVMEWFDRSIDLLIGTHADLDHVGGFPSVLNIYKIQRLIVDLGDKNDELGQILGKYSDSNLYQGDRLILDEDVYLDVLWPPRGRKIKDKNDSSYVLKLVYKNINILLTGDISETIEEELVRDFGSELKSDVLKIGHHGSLTSTSQFFLSAVNPRMAIVQVGENNYGHPSNEVLERLESFRIEIFRNDLNGNILLEIDGESINSKVGEGS